MGEDKLFTGIIEETNIGYGLSKMSSSILCSIIRDEFGYNYTTLIPCNLFGIGDNFDPYQSHLIPSIIRKSVESQKYLEVWGDGSDIKDFIYIEDFIKITYKLFKLKKNFLIVNVSSSKPILLRKVIYKIRNLTNKKLKIKYNKSKFRMIPVRKVSNSLLKKLINFKLDFSIDIGLKKTIEWYKLNSNDSK